MRTTGKGSSQESQRVIPVHTQKFRNSSITAREKNDIPHLELKSRVSIILKFSRSPGIHYLYTGRNRASPPMFLNWNQREETAP